MPIQSYRRKAFTLVELLVVIGIIALLISILLPALSKARESGNWVVCMSNLKQIGNAMVMYANENRGNLPRPASNGNGAYPDDFLNWLQKPAPSATGFYYPLNDSCLAPYLNVQDERLLSMFRCPSDAWADRAPQTGFTYPYRYSYSMNDEWSHWSPAHIPPAYGGAINPKLYPRKKLVQVRVSAEKILVIEEQNPNDGRWTHAVGSDDLATRHSLQGNILFTDMHVVRMYPADAMGKAKYWDPFN